MEQSEKKIVIQLWTSLVCGKLSMSFKHGLTHNFIKIRQ